MTVNRSFARRYCISARQKTKSVKTVVRSNRATTRRIGPSPAKLRKLHTQSTGTSNNSSRYHG